jgi:hypothetical protein
MLVCQGDGKVVLKIFELIFCAFTRIDRVKNILLNVTLQNKTNDKAISYSTFKPVSTHELFGVFIEKKAFKHDRQQFI